jgi:signal transduction histidine kinase
VISVSDLRTIDLLRDLPDARLEELLDEGRELDLRSGQYLFRQGDAAEFFSLVLEGELESTRGVAGDEVPFQHHSTGGFLGAIALLTGTPYRASTRAVTDCHLLLVSPDAFRRLLVSERDVFETVIKVFAPVLESVQAVDSDREHLLALGTLAAGLAHELNNPAAAAQRAASMLNQADQRGLQALGRVAEAETRPEAIATLCALAAEAVERSAEGVPLDPLERSDREDELATRLREYDVAQPYDAAASLVQAGLDEAWLAERVLVAVEPAVAGEAVAWIASQIDAARLADELEHATTRISSLVQAVRQHSYLDQTPRQDVDLHQGLESTLAILSHKLEGGSIEIVREFDRSLPSVDAYGAELNQVWTNLIDNAIDAVGDAGRVTLRTSKTRDRAQVEICDTGPGIPEDIRERIFDPFFTTKPPGSGTGIGLDIVRRIVVRHQGELDLETGPEGTCFRVLLPFGK